MTLKIQLVMAICKCGNEYLKTPRKQSCDVCRNSAKLARTAEWRVANKERLKAYKAANRETTKIYNHMKYEERKLGEKKKEIEAYKEPFVSHLKEKLNYAYINNTTYGDMQRAETLRMCGRVNV